MTDLQCPLAPNNIIPVSCWLNLIYNIILNSQYYLPIKRSAVTCPSWAIPSRLKTFKIVLNRILKSSPKLCCPTYQTSYSNFSSQEIAFRPFTCAQPVIPGFTLWRFRCTSLYKGKYSGNSGRGPTKLISPFKTFINWGNSSKDVLRTNFPIEVNRFESGNNCPSAPHLSFIVLNLIIVNIRSFLPGRRW